MLTASVSLHTGPAGLGYTLCGSTCCNSLIGETCYGSDMTALCCVLQPCFRMLTPFVFSLFHNALATCGNR